MEKPSFYNKEKVQSREDFFKGNAQTSSFVNDLFFAIIHKGVPAKARMLDIGTGNAFVPEHLTKKYPDKYWSLWGLDVSAEMLEKAKERVRGLDIKLVLGDNMNLPFESDSFDAVTAKNVTNFSESEVYRVLKTPGKFFFREYGPGKGLKEIADLFTGRLVRARDPSFYTQKLKSAGFRNISLRELFIKREYSLGGLLQVMQIFPFIDEIREEDVSKVRDYFRGKDKIQVTSDQIIIIGEK